jgi:hypothetical protein
MPQTTTLPCPQNNNSIMNSNNIIQPVDFLNNFGQKINKPNFETKIQASVYETKRQETFNL